MEESRIQALMEEGYRDMAGDNRQLAERAFVVVSELLGRTTRWDDAADDYTRRDQLAWR